VKTGVQAILNGLKILDSGFRRNDGKKMQADFFHSFGGRGGIFPAKTGFAGVEPGMKNYL